MPVVLDASVTAAWILPDEQTPNALQARNLAIGEGALVPAHWWYEVRNTLLMAERRQRTTAAGIATALASLRMVPIVSKAPAGDARIFELARRHRLTFYDAAYLELALRETVALATLDDRLAGAAAAEEVPLVIAR
jgi:predicted nucleic acid-binding protein